MDDHKNPVFCGISAYSIYDPFLHDLAGKLYVLLDAGTEKFVKLSGSFCRREGEISTYHISVLTERDFWIYHTLRICQLLSRRISTWKKRYASRMPAAVSCLHRDAVVIGSVSEMWAGKI